MSPQITLHPGTESRDVNIGRPLREEAASPLGQLASVVRCLRHDWRSNWRSFSPPSCVWRAIRSCRALLFLRQHWALARLGIYRDHLALAAGDNIFHHLSHRFYLAKHLSLRQRIEFALCHYRFEERSYDAAYKRSVYAGKGLVLWEKVVGDRHFCMRLSNGGRNPPEGDLCIALFINDERLHSINFSWVADGVPDSGSAVLPYITRNQGRWPRDPERLQQFEKAFPHNSPRYFCLAALQGLARTTGARRMLAISSTLQACGKPGKADHFANSYDAFWESLEATRNPFYGYAIPIPFHARPLSDVASKHRKRAAQRRALWQDIEEAAGKAVRQHAAPHGALADEEPAREAAAARLQPAEHSPAANMPSAYHLARQTAYNPDVSAPPVRNPP